MEPSPKHDLKARLSVEESADPATARAEGRRRLELLRTEMATALGA